MPRLERLRRSRAAGPIAWILVGAWALWALVRVLGLERGYPMVPLIAFTPYVAAASVMPLAVALLLRRRAAGVVAAVVACVFAAIVLPRAFGGGGADVADGVTVRVLSANLSFGEADPEAIAGLVEELDVDLLSAQELTDDYPPKLRRALGGRLANERLLTEAGASGGGLWSALPLEPSPGPSRLPGGFALPRALVTPQGAEPFELVGVHTVPPTEWGATDWDDDQRALPRADDGVLRVLAGDFNATLDHDELRELIDSGYTDAADAAGAGLTPTWPEGRRLPPTVAIDHVLADERIGIGDVSIHDLPGSDHRAVFAELELPR
jgi:endonuclease/exonuclease/phosphatase (EEP) superfamily protein YafD